MASITVHKNGYRVQCYAKGKRTSKVLRTHREAKAWGAQQDLELARSHTCSPDEIFTVRDVLERYDREISSKKAGARFETLRIQAFLRDFPDLAARLLANFHTPDIAAWRDVRLSGFVTTGGQTVRQVTNASVQRDVNWMKHAFCVARKEWHWLTHNPFDGLRLAAAAAARMRRILPSEVKRICRDLGYRTGYAPVSKSQEVALAFLIGLRTAMRAGEIISLGARSLDLQQRVAKVTHKMQYITGRQREIPLTRQAVRLLRPVAALERCFSIWTSPISSRFNISARRYVLASTLLARRRFRSTSQ